MPPRSFTTQALGLLAWVAASFAAGGLGAVASADADVFYRQLAQPSWAPPAWLFGPVWSALYLLMGVAAWRVWRKHGFDGAGKVLWLFIVQLAANALWTWLFFRWRLGAVAFAEIVLLWVLIAATLVGFWRLDRVAGLLLVPYLAWVSYAAALSFTLWQANPAILG
jgi:tryptophan-rich sensory protein